MTSTTSSKTTNDNINNHYVVRVTARFVVLSLVSCMLLAFAIGRVTSWAFLKHETYVLYRTVGIIQQNLQQQQQQSTSTTTLGRGAAIDDGTSSTAKKNDPDTDGYYTARTRAGSSSASSNNINMAVLPDPVMKFGKIPPPTEYTSKKFDMSSQGISSTLQSRWIVTSAGKSHDIDVLHDQQQQQVQKQEEEESEKHNCHLVEDDGSSTSSMSCNAGGSADGTDSPLPASSSGTPPPTNKSSSSSSAPSTQQQQEGNHKRYIIETPLAQHKHHHEIMTVGVGGGDDDEDEVVEIHLPAGQHLLMDIEKVDPTFLNDESRLARAMLELVDECGLTLLSYHCHKLRPAGVSCAGVLLESHVSFHTWPIDGVITLDLYTCGPNSLVPMVSTAERLFAIPTISSNSTDISTQPTMVWAHKYRGFYDNTTDDDVADLTDLQTFPLGTMVDYKKEIVTAETDFQSIYIVDVLRPGFQSLDDYQKSLSGDGSYQSRYPQFFEPDRIVFLDGVLQSRRSGDAQYHETLVHPGMFVHESPKRVAIIGGGEGATLREVLKHRSVETVFMIEIDELMVRFSREFLPGWSDCSNIVGSTSNCFDDPRVELRHIDAFKWFVDSFPEDETQRTEDPFDVIIMDALDPQIQKDFVDALYDGRGPFLSSLPRALSERGVLTAQVGEGSSLDEPPEIYTKNKNRIKFVNNLAILGFESILEYDDGLRSGFFDNPWKIMVAFKDFHTRAEWFKNEALVELKIHQRILPSKDGELLLRYFDGPLMVASQYPSKASEVVYCRGHPDVRECLDGHGFDPEREQIPISRIEVKQSSLGENTGRGVYAATDIPHMSYIGLDKLVPAVYADPQTFDLMDRGMNRVDWVYDHWWGETLEFYVNGYGHIFSFHGANEVFVDSTIQCFTNHACNGRNNVGFNISISEATADPAIVAPEIYDSYFGRDRIYNPAAERQTHFYSTATPLRDIREGEELFDTYIPMAGVSEQFWRESVNTLKAICNGEAGRTVIYDRHL